MELELVEEKSDVCVTETGGSIGGGSPILGLAAIIGVTIAIAFGIKYLKDKKDAEVGVSVDGVK